MSASKNRGSANGEENESLHFEGDKRGVELRDQGIFAKRP
jgi:hypothetical protein